MNGFRSMRMGVGVCGALVLAGVTVAMAGESFADGLSSAVMSPPVIMTTQFNYTGATEVYTVPDGVFGLSLQLYGASGGSINGPLGSGVRGGSGAIVKGDYAVRPGEHLAISVGGSGANQVNNNSHNGWSAIGFQGGQVPKPSLFGGAGGGGASVVQIASSSGPAQVVAVAGGGGGSGGYLHETAGAGGNAGAAPTQGGNGAHSSDPHLGGSGGTQGGSSSSVGANAGAGTPSQFNPAGGGGGGGGGYPRGGGSGGDASGADGGASGGGGGSGLSSSSSGQTVTIGPGPSPTPGASYDGKIVIGTLAPELTKLPSDNRFRILRLSTRTNGTVKFTLKLPGRGTIDILETAWLDNFARITRLLYPAPRRFVFARKHLTARAAGSTPVTVEPSQRGRALISRHRYPVLIRLWVSYTPTGGRQHNVGIYGLRITRRH